MSSKKPGAKEIPENEEPWQLCLYVAGMTPTARRTLSNLEAICEEHLPSHYTLRVVDLLEDSQPAEENHILAIPTLVRVSPGPTRKVIGDLSNRKQALAALDLDGLPSVSP